MDYILHPETIKQILARYPDTYVKSLTFEGAWEARNGDLLIESKEAKP